MTSRSLTAHAATVDIARELAPDGVLRAALNLSNSLLVSGGGPGEFHGIAPDLAGAIAATLGARLELVGYATPKEVADSVDTGAWSIAMIADEPARAQRIRFTPPYVEIEAGYLVPPGSALGRIDQVDQDAVRVAAYQGSAYDLWLTANLKRATLVHGKTFEDAFHRFREEGLEVLASLKPKLLADQKRWAGTRILDGRFMAVRQAIGTSLELKAAPDFLSHFIGHSIRTGLVHRLVAKHHVTGLTVAADPG